MNKANFMKIYCPYRIVPSRGNSGPTVPSGPTRRTLKGSLSLTVSRDCAKIMVVNEQAEEGQEDQESGSGQANTSDQRSEDQRVVDLTDEIHTESIKCDEVNDEHCKENEEEEGAMHDYQSKKH
jgi:hypothetical protein